MRISVTILLLFISIFSFGQKLQDTLLKALKPFDVYSNENLRILAGSFMITDGFGGYKYRLDTVGKFERVDFADIGGSYVSEKGKFRIRNNYQIELRSEKGHSTFKVFAFDNFSFIYKIGDENYTAYFMIAHFLLHDYLVKGVD